MSGAINARTFVMLQAGIGAGRPIS